MQDREFVAIVTIKKENANQSAKHVKEHLYNIIGDIYGYDDTVTINDVKEFEKERVSKTGYKYNLIETA